MTHIIQILFAFFLLCSHHQQRSFGGAGAGGAGAYHGGAYHGAGSSAAASSRYLPPGYRQRRHF